MQDKKANKSKPLTKKQLQFLDIYKNSAGNVSAACDKARIGRTIFYIWKNELPLFAEKVDEIDEMLLDFGESQLMMLMKGAKTVDETTKDVIVTNDKGIDEKVTLTTRHTKVLPPDVASVIFFLKTKGKKRGYVEKIETEHQFPFMLSEIPNKPELIEKANSLMNEINGK